MWAARQLFTPDISAFFMQHIPFGSDYLFPALNTVRWIENDCEWPKICLRTSPIEMPAFQAFRPAALRFLNFEMHDCSTPLGYVLEDKKFLDHIMDFITSLRQNFPDFYMSNICVCHLGFCAHPYIRTALNKLHAAVMSEFSPPFLSRYSH